MNAHERMKGSNPVLPVTVTDQLRLWSLETKRTATAPGFLYADFRAMGDYKLVVDYAETLNVVRWRDDVNRKFFISQQGHESVREFVKRRMQEARASGAEQL